MENNELQKQLLHMKTDISEVIKKLEIVRVQYIQNRNIVEAYSKIDNIIYKWLKNNS
jgi:hypothetical protein